MTLVVATAALSLARFSLLACLRRPCPPKQLVCLLRPCPPKGGWAGRRPRESLCLRPAAARSGTLDRLARVAAASAVALATPLRRTPEVPPTTCVPCVPTWTSIDEYVVGVGTKRRYKELMSSEEDGNSTCSGA